jgi:hypothetical protein
MNIKLFPNYIAGSWVTSSEAKPNINPSDLFEYGIFTYGLKAGFDYRLTDLIRFGFDATATKINDLSITDFDYSIDGTMSMKLTF